jgi:hypothetical protein
MSGEASPLVAYLRLQERYCAEHGSPLYGALLDAMVDDVLDGGPTAGLLVDWLGPGAEADAVARDLPALRVLGGVHRLVLTGRARDLAAHYPSVGGTAGAAGAWPALRRVLAEHADEVRPWLASPPQTNEIGRSVPLLGGLRHVAVATGGLPVRLFEFGASAGLNLCADHLPVGPGLLLDSPLPLPDAPVAAVVERVGGDLRPIDPTTDDVFAQAFADVLASTPGPLPKASRRPSGDQDGSHSENSLAVARRALPPADGTM